MKTSYSLLHRSLVFAYAVAAYLVALATFGYTAGFIGNFLVPKTLDATANTPFWASLLTNLGLIAVFGVQHSVMARPAFKRWWTRIIPKAAERSTYVLFSCLALLALFVFWQPMGGSVWEVTNGPACTALYGVYAAGWALLFAATFFINHFDLMGLRQAWLHLVGKEYTELPFATPALYRVVRHPLYVGWLLIFWATPVMTVAHLVFALATTAYILIAIRWEERDLVAAHPEYADYRERVPMLIPSPRNPALPSSAETSRDGTGKAIADLL